jgi:hypothetical protein
MISTRKVLLLNATYEPLSLVTPPKAVTLIWRRVAESLEIDPGHILRSPRYVFEVPSVIRLYPVHRRSGAAEPRHQPSPHPRSRSLPLPILRASRLRL